MIDASSPGARGLSQLAQVTIMTMYLAMMVTAFPRAGQI